GDCFECHAPLAAGVHLDGFTSFASGVDTNSNGSIELGETDVCDACHSPDGPFDGVAEGKANWAVGTAVSCEGCHDTGTSTIQGVTAPPVAGNNTTWGYFATGHGRNGALGCAACHDTTTTHFDGVARTYAFDSAYYGPAQSGVAYAAGYRLREVGGEVPLMIPANYSITFNYIAQAMADNAFRLCFNCHDSSALLDNTPGDGIDSNFKASLPNPPRNYSYAWGSGADINEHFSHIMNYIMPAWDSDWDVLTTGIGTPDDGFDSLTTCSSCHNVHGAVGTNGSTNETMVRDGSLAGRSGYGFSYVVKLEPGESWEDDSLVTSEGATRSTSVGAVLRNVVDDMCFDCHGGATSQAGTSYDATGPYLEYFRAPGDFGGCTACHGQPPDGTAFPNTAGAHAMHMVSTNGPGISDCFVCHAALAGGHLNDITSFASGVDANSNGDIELDETDVCDACHSPDGPFDGAAEGKANWAVGTAVSCEGCHDAGSSTIQGVSAPPVAGDNATWGYYATGHGRSGMVACTECHDSNMAHFDGVADTYQAPADNYQAGFRLKSVNGGPPMVIPMRAPAPWDPYDDSVRNWDLCFSCHDRYALFGGPDAPAGPYYADKFSTNFRKDASVLIPDGPPDTDIADWSMGFLTGTSDENSHVTHMFDAGAHYDSDHNGTWPDSYVTCVACHNVHGSTSPAMVRDGKLLDAEPGLNYSYVRYDRHDTDPGCLDAIVMTSAGPVPQAESHGGIMRASNDITVNGVCATCHGSGASTTDPEYWINCNFPDYVDYYRTPITLGTGCGLCHGQTVDNGDGVPPGGRRAVIPHDANSNDFGNTSHHIRGEVQASDCIVCHDMSQHQQGHVRLLDPDDAGVVYDYDTITTNGLETFCLNCHDADGAADGPGMTPFSDGATVPNVKGIPGSMWSDSAHKVSNQRCPDCHVGNAHGSDNIKLLQTARVDTLCYTCHTEGMVQNDALANNRPGGYISADDIEEAFAKSRRHDLGQAFTVGTTGFTLQCTSCHNPHVVTGKYWDAELNVTPVTRADFSDPVNNPRAMGSILWGDEAGEKMDDFAARGSGTGGWAYSTARGGGISWDQPAVYQPPKSGNGYDFEFGGDILPDYTTLCLDCHTHRMSDANPPVNWGQGIGCTDNSVDPPNQRIECGADHGLGAAGRPQYNSDDGTAGFWGNSGNPDMIYQMNYVTRGRGTGHFMRWPYETAERAAGINFVLSCTDCHEAHGADRGGMVRERFNVNANGDCGTGGDADPNGENCTDGGNWNSMCNACHYYYGGQHAGMSCGNASCHEANSIHRIIHTVDSGASTGLQLTASGYESDYARPDFTPEIETVDGHIGSDELQVTFTQPTYTSSDLTGNLTPDDFWLFDVAGNNPKSIVGVTHTPGDTTATLTLTNLVAADDLSSDILALKPGSVWNWYGGGYENWATGIILEQPVSGGPWPAIINGPPLVGITLAEGVVGHSELYVTFNEPVYGDLGATGDLDLNDFTLTDAEDGRTITGVTHFAGDDTAILTVAPPLDDIDDMDVDTLAAVSSSVYDEYNNPAGTDPVVITALVGGPSITLVHGVDGFNRLAVRFSENVYASPDGTGALQVSDFVYADVEGKSITAVEHTAGAFSAALILSGDIVSADDIGADMLAASGSSIYDVTGHPASTAQVTLAQGLASAISIVEGVVGQDELKVTLQSQVYSSTDETGVLQVSDFVLSAGGHSIDSVQHAAGSSMAVITLTGPLTGGDIGVSGVSAATRSIFGPSPGNFPLGTDSVTISALAAPLITKVEGAVGYDLLTISFSEGVYTDPGQSGALDVVDLTLVDSGDGKAIIGVAHEAGQSVAVLTLDGTLTAGDVGAGTVEAAGSAIYNSIENPVGTDPVTVQANACPAWGTTFDFSEGAGSATTTDDSGLLVGSVGNPAFSMLGDGLHHGDETEAQATYVDINNAGYDKAMMSPRAFTIETRFFAGDVDLDYADADGNGFDDDYDVGDDPLSKNGDGRNYTGQRIIERQGTFQLTLFRAGFGGDYVESRAGQARLILKYRADDDARHTCPHPQWPDDDYSGADAAMHQISTDIDQWPIVSNHWYQVKVVFNSDKSEVSGSDGTPADIFVDDQGTDGSHTDQLWDGYVNASRTINGSSSCKWGALPGDYVRTIDKFTAIGDNLNHGDIPGDSGNLMFKGQIDWLIWQPVADYSGVDDPPS
ncbi:MAG: hypothetical protein GY842_06575, partial [bacterium]|nr:hypothetical protein [bacterium]